jgi:hypothetical protein
MASVFFVTSEFFTRCYRDRYNESFVSDVQSEVKYATRVNGNTGLVLALVLHVVSNSVWDVFRAEFLNATHETRRVAATTERYLTDIFQLFLPGRAAWSS